MERGHGVAPFLLVGRYQALQRLMYRHNFPQRQLLDRVHWWLLKRADKV